MSSPPSPSSTTPGIPARRKTRAVNRLSTKRPRKKRNRNLMYLKLNLKESVATGLINPINKVQLSLLQTALSRKFIKITEDIEKASGIIPSKPFDLWKPKYSIHVQLLRTYPVLLKIEYHVATKGEQHSMRHALKEENESKNAKFKILPFDYNRVVLETLPGIPDSDYINASYIDSPLKPNAYIAAQGPVDETIADFWRMIWEQKTYVIVMLTKVFDLVRVMCSKYWPVDIDKAEYHAPMEVTLLAEENLADYTIRTFRLKKRFSVKNDSLIEKTMRIHINEEDEEGRIIYQFQYYSWHIHECPSVNSLLQFRRRVRVYMLETGRDQKTGPIVVHCSDGCGRTGTFLGIDANLEYADEDNLYDVFGFTKKMRSARKGMIESVEQYKFVYECLEEAHISGKTWFPVQELPAMIKFKSAKHPVSRTNVYQQEFEKIVRMTKAYSIGDCAGGHRIENRDKNREVGTIPPDNFRPYLSTFQSNDSTDYVNAVFIDGYTRAKEYIITEWPMPHTVPDCWSLIYDHDCNSVVVLGNPTDKSVSILTEKWLHLTVLHMHQNYPSFWPTEKDKRRKFGPVFTVDCISYNHYANIKSWIVRINKKVVSLTELMSGVKGVPKTTQIFQITCWPQGHKVPSSTNALVELMNMVERWRQRTTYGPVCVISTNGKSRVGVYCAANVAIEQVVQHGEVDVFQAVKTVRRNRPVVIENMTEYKYCYDLVLHYVIHYLNEESE